MNKQNVLINILCPDRPGLIAAISGALYELDINLGDTTFSILGEGAEFTAVGEATLNTSVSEINDHLRTLDELKNSDITVKTFSYGTGHKESGNITHQITVQGNDQPGLVARLTEVFVDYDANIVRMDNRKLAGAQGSEYLIQLWVWIPASREEACLATVSNTAGLLNLVCEAKRV